MRCEGCTSRSSRSARIYQHAFTRTVTEMDNVLFTSLTMNLQPLHLDEEFSKRTIHGQRVSTASSPSR